MKCLIIAFAFATSLAGHANVPSFQEEQDSIQIGKIEAAMLIQIDEEIQQVESSLTFTINNLGEPRDLIEGKIQAALIQMIRGELITLKEMRSALSLRSEILDSDIRPIEKKATEIRELIENLEA